MQGKLVYTVYERVRLEPERRYTMEKRKIQQMLDKEIESMQLKNPVWDEDAVYKYGEAVEIAQEIFKDAVWTDPKEPSMDHAIWANVNMMSLHGAKLKKFNKLVALSEEIDGEPLTEGKAFQLTFMFTLCREGKPTK